ncbi:MAG: hypothetical protein ACP5VF_10335 [Acidobacteriota bacterium]
MWIGSEGFGARLRGLLGDKEEVREHPRRQRRPDWPDLVSYLPLDLCEDRAKRNEAVYDAYIEGRFSQREIADYLGLHYVTVSGIVRAKKLEKRQEGKTERKRR